jgi:purine-binding chemotaxis protein CheW
MNSVEVVWRRRATLLARPAPTPAATTAAGSLLVFRAGSERYALELIHLGEVVPARPCSFVPGAGPALAGITAVRGEVRPVWDLAQLLRLPPTGRDPQAAKYVVFLRGGAGLLVDQIDEILPPPLPDFITLLDPAALRRRMEEPHANRN